MKRNSQIAVLVVLFLFALLSAVRHFSSPGADLSSSYYGCRLLASHQIEHVYSRDPVNYDRVSDPVWDHLATATGFSAVRILHPYVQTPLWAFSIRPLCTSLSFPVFNGLFLFLLSFSLVGTIWLVARFWAPRTFHPGWIALICATLYLTEAYKYAFMLTQTHMIFVLLTIGALLLARRGAPVSAGLLLAIAAAIKITPGFLLLYWLINRQTRAAVSFVGFSALLVAVSLLSTGLPLNLIFLHNLSQISNMLLVSWNNQSLAAFVLAGHYPVAEQQLWHSFPLPPAMKWLSTLLTVAFTALGGLLDRRSEQAGPVVPPYGAVLALLAAVIFAPLSWTHYYILLVVPLMIMLDEFLRKRSVLLLALILVVLALNFDTQTLGGVLQKYRLFPIVRAQFYSGLLTMAALVLLWVRRERHPDRDVAPGGEPASREQPLPASV